MKKEPRATATIILRSERGLRASLGREPAPAISVAFGFSFLDFEFHEFSLEVDPLLQ